LLPKHFSFPFGLPENISAPAAQIACASYKNVFSSYRDGNFHAEARRILKRGNFPLTIWELELQLQSVLTGDTREPPHLNVRFDEHGSSNRTRRNLFGRHSAQYQ
jgi:hypothetical protein